MRTAFAAALALLLTACDEHQDPQNRLRTYGSARGSDFWPSRGEALSPPAGTIDQGALQRQRELREPPQISLALIQRGRERYDIYCAACHGLAGDGDGIVVARGFPHPLPFDDPKLMAAPANQFVDAIGNGYGRMYGFSDRVEPRDRWAIVAYIRALQRAARGAQP